MFISVLKILFHHAYTTLPNEHYILYYCRIMSQAILAYINNRNNPMCMKVVSDIVDMLDISDTIILLSWII